MADNKEFEKLKSQYAQAKSKVQQAYLEYKKKQDPSTEERKRIRGLVIECANIAKKLSESSSDEKESEQYKKDYLVYVERSQSFGSSAKGKIPNTKLSDVKGLKEVHDIIESFIYMTKYPDIYKAYKLNSGLGILMYGPPGTGKTMIAEAIANELNVPFFLVTPADIFKSHVGESEEAVKLLFYEMECCTDGCVLFIDECESIFARRSENTERYQSAVTTELLQRMNGFGVDGSNRVLIAATNRPEMIDPAYLRYKRFSTLVFIDLPDYEAKKAIITSKLKGLPLDESLSIDDVVQLACKPGKNYSGADLCGIIDAVAMSAVNKIRSLKLENPINLTYEMFVEVFDSYPQTVSDESLEKYRNFKID